MFIRSGFFVPILKRECPLLSYQQLHPLLLITFATPVTQSILKKTKSPQLYAEVILYNIISSV